jgi:hypothetical protein
MRDGWTFIDVDKFEDTFNNEESDRPETVDIMFSEFETIIIGMLKDNTDQDDFKPIKMAFIDRMEHFLREVLAIK